ncbi:MAG: 30S ribosomal protein S6 [Candidatus Cloacimonadia bacterium]
MKNNRTYESMFIIHADLIGMEDKIQEIINNVKSLIANNGGEVKYVDEWGTRKFAYEINHKSEGYYVVIYFALPSDKIPDMENFYNLNEDIVRSIIIKRDKLKIPEEENYCNTIK